MRPIVLYRDFDLADAERAAIHEAFPGSTDSRMKIQPGDLVIGRYSVLPFYKEQERDINLAGARLINTYAEHRYVADLVQWTPDLAGLTPDTWLDLSSVQDHDFPVVLKGETNSRKHLWSTHMFARDRAEMTAVYGRLLDDSLIGQQQIYARKYVPLTTYLIGVGGVPVTKEFRVFVCYGEILSIGYYWSSHAEDVKEKLGELPSPQDIPQAFLKEIIKYPSRKNSALSECLTGLLQKKQELEVSSCSATGFFLILLCSHQKLRE